MNHSFNVDIATTYGVPCAVILEHIWFWVDHNEANGKHFHDGRYWTYNSVKAFSKQFPYLTAKQIRTALDKLRAVGLIETGNYNENAYDRTLWYALTENGKSIFHTGQNNLPNEALPFAPQGEPIPDIKPYIEPCINNDEKEERAREEEPDPNSPWFRFVKEYEQNIGLMPTSYYALQELQSNFEILGAEVMSEAIKVTALKHTTNPHRFLQSVCKEWISKDVHTVDQARAAVMDHERYRKGGKGNAATRGSPDESPREPINGETIV